MQKHQMTKGSLLFKSTFFPWNGNLSVKLIQNCQRMNNMSTATSGIASLLYSLALQLYDDKKLLLRFLTVQVSIYWNIFKTTLVNNLHFEIFNCLAILFLTVSRIGLHHKSVSAPSSSRNGIYPSDVISDSIEIWVSWWFASLMNGRMMMINK